MSTSFTRSRLSFSVEPMRAQSVRKSLSLYRTDVTEQFVHYESVPISRSCSQLKQSAYRGNYRMEPGQGSEFPAEVPFELSRVALS